MSSLTTTPPKPPASGSSAVGFGAVLFASLIVLLAATTTLATAALTVHPSPPDIFGSNGQSPIYTHTFDSSLNGSTTLQGEFNRPCGTAVDSNGYLYVATHGSTLVSVFEPNRQFIPISEPLTQFSPLANGAAPCGLAVDSAGNVYVNGRYTDVYRYSPSEFPPTDATTYGAGTAVDTGSGSTAVAVNPADDHVFVNDGDHVVEYDSAANSNALIDSTIGQGIVSDSYGLDVYGKNGRVYVNDETTRKVYVLDAAGNTVLEAIDGTNVPAFPGGFGSLVGQGLTVDQSKGNVFVADVKDHAGIDEFTATGTYVDHISNALLDSAPTDVAVDNSGGFYGEYVYVTSGSGPGGVITVFQPDSPNRFGSGISKLSIDQARHRLYVFATAGGASIRAYDISVPGTYTPIGGNFPLTGAGVGGGLNMDLAVDQTPSPSVTAGNIYTVNNGLATAYGWSSEGVPLNAGSGWPSFPLDYTPPTALGNQFYNVEGIAVAEDGTLWLANQELCFSFDAGTVEGYDPVTGLRLDFIDVTEQGDIPSNITGCGTALDLNAEGDISLAFSGNNTGGVWRYSASSSYASTLRFDPQTAQDVAVDRSTGITYVVHGVNNVATPGIDAYDPDLGLFERFATDVPMVYFQAEGSIKTPGITSQLSGIAIDESTGTVYVADRSSGGRILVFPGMLAPVVQPPTGVTQSGATLHATIDPQSQTFDDCEVEYVAEQVFKSTGYTDLVSPGPELAGTEPCTPTGPYSNAEQVSATLAGLDYGTTYHYRFLVTAATGTIRGVDNTFPTDPAVYDVQTDAADPIAQTTATLNGSFSGNGQPAAYYFQWGADSSYGNATPLTAVPAGTGTVMASAGLQNLVPQLPTSEPYHYRLVVTNSVGTTYGPDRSLLPLPPLLPQVSATSAADLVPDGATVSALVNPGFGPTEVVFQYGTSTSYGFFTPTGPPVGDDNADHPANAQLSGLQPATIYHFRALATNFSGTTFGPDTTFTTPDLPEITASSTSAVTQVSAQLAAKTIANASPTSTYFQYGTDRGYGQSTASVPIGSDLIAHESTADISGLSPATTYHFRAVATNAIGTIHGPDTTFATSSLVRENEVQTPPCRRGLVRRGGRCICKKGTVKRKGRCVKPKPNRGHRKQRGRERG